MLCLSLLLGCSKSSIVPNDSVCPVYDVQMLSECPLIEYSETEIAQCYISLTLEVRKGNKQLDKLK